MFWFSVLLIPPFKTYSFSGWKYCCNPHNTNFIQKHLDYIQRIWGFVKKEHVLKRWLTYFRYLIAVITSLLIICFGIFLWNTLKLDMAEQKLSRVFSRLLSTVVGMHFRKPLLHTLFYIAYILYCIPPMIYFYCLSYYMSYFQYMNSQLV